MSLVTVTAVMIGMSVMARLDITVETGISINRMLGMEVTEMLGITCIWLTAKKHQLTNLRENKTAAAQPQS